MSKLQVLHHFNHRGRWNAVMNQAISMNKTSFSSNPQRYKTFAVLLPECTQPTDAGISKSLDTEQRERGPVPRDGTQQQDWSHRALVCCLAGISIVYWQQSTLHHSPSYHRFIIQHHTSVCNRSSKENQHISLPLAKTSQKIYQYHER